MGLEGQPCLSSRMKDSMSCMLGGSLGCRGLMWDRGSRRNAPGTPEDGRAY